MPITRCTYKYINGYKCDTLKSKWLGINSNRFLNEAAPDFWEEVLYVNKNKQYFLVVTGGPESKYAKTIVKDGKLYKVSNSDIVGFKDEEAAKGWAKENLGDPVYRKIFEPSRNEITKFNVMLTSGSAKLLQHTVDATGLNRSVLFEMLIREHLKPDIAYKPYVINTYGPEKNIERFLKKCIKEGPLYSFTGELVETGVSDTAERGMDISLLDYDNTLYIDDAMIRIVQPHLDIRFPLAFGQPELIVDCKADKFNDLVRLQREYGISFTLSYTQSLTVTIRGKRDAVKDLLNAEMSVSTFYGSEFIRKGIAVPVTLKSGTAYVIDVNDDESHYELPGMDYINSQTIVVKNENGDDASVVLRNVLQSINLKHICELMDKYDVDIYINDVYL